MDADSLRAAAREYQRARRALDRARDRLVPEIIAAAERGMRQADIARAVGLTPERVRKILAG